MSDEELASLFHSTYEDLAPTYGYETRKESAVPWSEVPEQNRLLMCEVVSRVRSELTHARVAELEHENAELRQKVSDVEWDHGFRPDSKGDPEKWWERLRKKAQQECDDG